MSLYECMKYDNVMCHPDCHEECFQYHTLKAKSVMFTDEILSGMYPDLVRIPKPPIVEPEVPPRSEYELTITTTKDDPYELRMIINKIAESKMFGVNTMPYCFELQKNGMPHVHCYIYSSKKYLDASKMKKFIPYRFELKRVINSEAYINYLYKEKDNPLIIDYCLKKGIKQFDNAIQENLPQEDVQEEKLEEQEGITV